LRARHSPPLGCADGRGRPLLRGLAARVPLWILHRSESWRRGSTRKAGHAATRFIFGGRRFIREERGMSSPALQETDFNSQPRAGEAEGPLEVAPRGQRITYIVTGHKYLHHANYSAAARERDRLKERYPAQRFRVVKVLNVPGSDAPVYEHAKYLRGDLAAVLAAYEATLNPDQNLISRARVTLMRTAAGEDDDTA